jgi:capsular exopolysaccharide synthesis family protein
MSDKAQIDREEFDIMHVIGQVVKRWYWFVLTVPLFLGIAKWKNDNALPLNTTSAKILVDIKDQRVVYGDDAMSGMNHLFRSKKINNEVAMLQSRDLIQRALDSLNLNVAFFYESDMDNEVFAADVPLEIRADFSKTDVLKGTQFKVAEREEGEYQIWADNKELGLFKRGQIISYQDFHFFIDKRYDNWKDHALKEPLVFYMNSEQATLQHFVDGLQVLESEKDTDAILLSIEETLPERGIAFLEQLIECYFLQVLENRQSIAESTYDFIDDRVQMNYGHLDSVENAIDRYKRDKGIANPEVESRYILEGIKSFEIELNDAETQRDIVQSLIQMTATDTTGNMDISVPQTMLGVTDYLLMESLKDLNQKQYRLNKLKETVRDENPLVREKVREVNELRVSIIADLKVMQGNMGITVDKIQNQINSYNAQLSGLSFNEKGLMAMERLKNNKEELYVYLLKKREEAAMVLATEMMDTWVIEQPYVSNFYYNPKRSIVLLIGLFLGFFIPTTIILLWMMFDGKVRSESEVRQEINKPIMGRIPKVKKMRKSQNEINEEFKRLSFNLRFIKNDHKVIMVTSMDSNEGKSFTSKHVALTNAKLGKKTCLLELDLRRPSMAEHMGVEGHKTLIDYFIENLSVDDITVDMPEQAGAQIIFGGPVPLDPTDLLISDKLKQLITELKRKFDLVVIDTPPIGVVTDPLLISKYSDINLLVIREGVTKKASLKTLSENLKREGLDNMAIVFNGINSKPQDNYYLKEDKRLKNFKGLKDFKSPILKKSQGDGWRSKGK